MTFPKKLKIHTLRSPSPAAPSPCVPMPHAGAVTGGGRNRLQPGHHGAPGPEEQQLAAACGHAGHRRGEALARALPGADVVLIPEGAAVTMDYRLNRVRIFVTDRSESGTVVRAPARG